ncbi:hypothetical protein BgAZ_207810 [Babesia gibsoni]|uniref:Uncharacterized protein n=1 Tax=Babesia gibsoni TaxID=33632 RepID=A0AAD8UQS0_BABGI|nr:hypothetical protein BgAZ_207810 [Babesia gibsoni]
MQSPDIDIFDDVDGLSFKAPLFLMLLNEKMLLEEEFPSTERLSQRINSIARTKGCSLPKLLAEGSDDRNGVDAGDTANATISKPPLLFKDLQWKDEYSYAWPIRGGDFSPLSPDGELLERSGKIGLDFWRWHRDTAPLGYTPPLCTCKRTKHAQETLKRYATGVLAQPNKAVCDNDVCRGLLYIPYSLIELPLNRRISNGSEFVRDVGVPNETDVYCGNMKHTLVICTTSPEHEVACLKAISNSELAGSLVYNVRRGTFIPYFKKYVQQKAMGPLMTVEPIDSDVSDSNENYGFGDVFAIKIINGGIVIHKYNTVHKAVMPLDPSMLRTWMGINDSSPEDMPKQAEVTSVKDYILCELIESFSNERRPLGFSLRDYTFTSQKAEAVDNASDGRKRVQSSSPEEPTPLPVSAIENAHIMKIIRVLEEC